MTSLCLSFSTEGMRRTRTSQQSHNNQCCSHTTRAVAVLRSRSRVPRAQGAATSHSRAHAFSYSFWFLGPRHSSSWLRQWCCWLPTPSTVPPSVCRTWVLTPPPPPLWGDQIPCLPGQISSTFPPFKRLTAISIITSH